MYAVERRFTRGRRDAPTRDIALFEAFLELGHDLGMSQHLAHTIFDPVE
jgi:hypothetical protein